MFDTIELIFLLSISVLGKAVVNLPSVASYYKLLGINQVYSDDRKAKHTNIATICKQHLIRNYLQKILKCEAMKLGLVGSAIYQNEKGLSAKVWIKVLKLLIKIRECLTRMNICN